MKRIVVIGGSDQFYGRVQQAFPDAGERLYRWFENLDGVTSLRAILTLDPAVVVFGPDLPPNVALTVASEFDRARPDVSVVIAARESAIGVEQALAVGVRGVLRPDSDPKQIAHVIGKAFHAVQARSTKAPRSEPTRVPKSRVITVAGPKGGSGKTMVSTNLAVGLASMAPRGVVILDLDLQFGDVAYALSLKPRHSLYDAVSTTGPLDLTTLKVFIAHHRSELYALCAPEDPARGEMISADSVSEIVSLLMSEFRYVVIDTNAGLSEHTLSAFEVSTDVVFLADMDVPSVRHLRKVLDALDRLGMTEHERHYVLNRADSRVGLTMADAAKAAGISIDIEIPSSRHVPVALNTGTPLLLSNPKSPVSRALRTLIDRFATAEEHPIRRPMKWSA